MQLLVSEIMNNFIGTEKQQHFLMNIWLHVIRYTSKDTICKYIDNTIQAFISSVNIHGNIMHKDTRDIKSVMIIVS